MANRAAAPGARSSPEANLLQAAHRCRLARNLQEAHSLQASQRATQLVPWLWAIILGVVLLTGTFSWHSGHAFLNTTTAPSRLSSILNPCVILANRWTSPWTSHPGGVGGAGHHVGRHRGTGRPYLIGAVGLASFLRTVAGAREALGEGAAPADGHFRCRPVHRGGGTNAGLSLTQPSADVSRHRWTVRAFHSASSSSPTRRASRELARLMSDVVVFVHSIPRRELEHLTRPSRRWPGLTGPCWNARPVCCTCTASPASPGMTILMSASRPAVDREESPRAPAGAAASIRGLWLSTLERVGAFGSQRRLRLGACHPYGRLRPSGSGAVAAAPVGRAPPSMPVAVMVAAAAASAFGGRAFVRASWKWEAGGTCRPR